MAYYNHETAEISKDAVIGEGTKVWNHSQIRENAVVGEDCIIGKNVYIDLQVVIGSNVKIQNNVSVYHGVEIEDDVFVGPSVTFTNDMYPRAFNNEWKVTTTLVRKGASIGANSTIVCGVQIGEYAMIGAGSVVTKDVGKYELWVGNPARFIGYVCKCGLRMDEELVCHDCGKVYKINDDNELVCLSK